MDTIFMNSTNSKTDLKYRHLCEMKNFNYRTDHILFQIFEINSSTYFLRVYYLKLVTHEVIKFLGSNENE